MARMQRGKGSHKKKRNLRQDNPLERTRKFRKQKKRQRGKRICPTHNVPLVHAHDEEKLQWVCPTPGCKVRCLAGHTSTPFDPVTGGLRAHVHEAFDPLWKPGPQRRFAKRGSAYDWLARVLKVDRELCHIGMFDELTCRLALAAVDAFVEGGRA